ncbi:MAG: leucine-rich repeat domain-containing protein, partial [Lachnospiraceae bacterium]|nr:leucine-rich repeat domain-containing protein [Lachnospiraceae bacterium]
DFYDPSSYSEKGNRHPLEGIDFPASLQNLTMKNIYWEKNTQTKSHNNADINLTNLRKLELYNTDVNVGSGESYFNHHTQITLTDTEGVLSSCIIENTDVESIKLINNSNGKGIKAQDEKQRIRFSASDCQNLKSIEFLGEGYAVEGSLNLTNDIELTHIGVPNADNPVWTVYGEFDSTYAPINVILNSCTKLGSDCSEIVIDYDFINRRDINVQALDTNFSDDHKLSIYREPRLPEDTAGKVYLSCDSTGSNLWIYNKYKDESGFVIENRTSFPTIAVFTNGQRIRTSGEGIHNNGEYTEDSNRWVERWDLVMSPKGYSNDFGNLTFYVVDKTDDGAGNHSESLRKVFYKENVYVEWNEQNTANSIITLPTEYDATKNAYKLTGTKLSSTGIPGEAELKLYVYNADGTKSYIGYQNIKVFKMPSFVELVNDGTLRGSGTKNDPYIINKNEELKLKARLLVKNGENAEVDRAGDFALRDVIWRIKEYDETPKYTSDSDGYSLYTLDSATRAGIDVVRGQLNSGETEEQYDRRTDATYYSHRRFVFNTTGSKFKIVAQSPYKYNSDAGELVITSEVYVVCNNSTNPGGGSSGGENPGGNNPSSEKPSDGNSGGDNSGSGNSSQSSVPVYTVSAGTIPSGTIPVYSTIPVDPVKDPEKPTLGLPVIEKKNPGVYVIPDITKNEVVYMAPPVDNTRKTITIPDRIVINGQVMSVVKIDPGAFKNNENIETIKIGKNIKVIGNGAFEGATNLKRIALGRNVETIGDGAFKGCTKLTTVTIPNKTTKIGASAFEGDTKLRNITIGKNVESIGDFAFKDCVSLTSIIIPSKVTNIGVAVFAGCTKLNTLKIVSKKLTSIGVAFGAFYGLTERTTIRVPWSMLNTYRGLFEEKGIISTVKIKRY